MSRVLTLHDKIKDALTNDSLSCKPLLVNTKDSGAGEGKFVEKVLGWFF